VLIMLCSRDFSLRTTAWHLNMTLKDTFYSVLDVDPRTLHMLGQYSTIEL
jgi:hypothetical protein